MENRRQFKRSLVDLKARYVKENEEGWHDCTIVNIGLGGMGITVYMREKPPIGSFLHIEITVPAKENPVKVTGVLRWITEHKEERIFTGGIEFNKLLDEIALANVACFIS